MGAILIFLKVGRAILRIGQRHILAKNKMIPSPDKTDFEMLSELTDALQALSLALAKYLKATNNASLTEFNSAALAIQTHVALLEKLGLNHGGNVS